ncbi:TP53-binding protein 1-like [Centruroides sculpturatus]|uniref:TP53-binding protein 1-like n=1 Tax=Centruroides sculpturatus TaxID=218467 RepID=UPI000C6DC18E|nr:TP53-binding protein 1-like [Centruroides sculpturatus]
MAKWKDGYYYPGTICSQISDTRWTVLFDDGDSKPIWEKDLIAISLLKKGQAVYALSEDGCYDQGIIRDYYRDGKEIGYIIEKEYNEFEKYPRSSVTLSSEQANSLIKSNSEITESPSGINLDNIIEGKRRHSSRSNSSREKKQKSPRNLDYNKYRNILERKSSSEEINNIGKSLKQSGMKQNTRSSRSSDSKSDIISDFKQETPQKKKVSDCKRILSWKSSMNEGSDENIKVLQKSSFLSNNQSNDQPTHTFKSPRIQKAEKCKLSKLTGEIGKVEKKRLFVGYAFLLTSAEKKTDNKEFLSSDSCVDISEEEVIDEYPFEKSVVQNQIEARGGIVLESIEEIQTVKANQIFLLSNTYLRTIKYIHCLAASIPCISHLWVRDCCKTNKIQSFKTYLLPAGFNIIEKCEIEWHGKKGVLKDIHILLASSKENFAEVWTPVLLAAQAEIVHRFPPPRNTSGSVCNIDIVLTDPSCPQSIVRRANQMKVPLVSIEWVVQCLISGYKLPIDLHPKFSYDA